MASKSKVEQMLSAKRLNALFSAIKKDPIQNFIQHPEFLDFMPTPAQKVALKCIFKQALDETTKWNVYEEIRDKDDNFDLEYRYMTEPEIYELMTGRIYRQRHILDKDRSISMIDFICGRRSGKSTIASILAIYYAIIENWKPYLTKTPYATVLILSHSKEFSEEVMDMMKGMINESDLLSGLVSKRYKNTATTINLEVPFLVEGELQISRVQIRVGAASSKTTRGKATCVVLCDEIAFWNLDENMKETDYKIMKAVRPALLQFDDKGLLIKLSSPAIKQGVLYNEYKKWMDSTLPESYIVFKAPSWVWNTILPKRRFIDEWKIDPDGFDSEYRSNFVDSVSDFLNSNFIDLCKITGTEFEAPEAGKTTTYSAAIDAAYKGDTFTFSVVGNTENRIKQYICKGWEGDKKDPVKISEVAQYIRTICKEYGINSVSADQYSFEPLREIFETYGVTLVEKTFTNTFKKKIYFNLKRLINSQQLDLLDHEKLLKELKEINVTQTGSGQIKIGHPPGGSDDYADSLAIAAFEAVEMAGKLGADMDRDIIAPDNPYDIATDIYGRAFTAPSPTMLGEIYGYEIIDNSFDALDLDDEEEEDENSGFSSSF